MNTEIWKDVVGYEGLYQVSSQGRVRSVDRVIKTVGANGTREMIRKGKILAPCKRQHGYLGVQLHGKGGHATRNFKTFSIHRLVAEAFLQNPNNLSDVNHKDENKTNNCLENLEWISHKDNTNYGTTQARRSAKMRNNKRSKPISQYTRDMVFVKTYPSIAEAQRQTGYAQANICRCANGDKSYSHAYGYIWRYA